MRISMIVAMAHESRVIGYKGDTPWGRNLPSDLKHFKEITVGHPVIMGRVTAEAIITSLGKPLPGRTNIALTNSDARAEFLRSKGFTTTGSLDSALAYAEGEDGGDEIFIIGGEQIYKLAMPLAQKIYMTTVYTDMPGDAFFPEFSDNQWLLSKSPSRQSENKFEFEFHEYTRIKNTM